MPAESSPRSSHPNRIGQWRLVSPALLLALLLVQPLAMGCFGGRARPAQDAAAREAEITALEASIASDRAELADMVATPRDLDLNPLHDDAQLRMLATRLRAETARLDVLEAEAAEAAKADNTAADSEAENAPAETRP